MKELSAEVAVALLEQIKKAADEIDFQNPEGLRTLAEAYATVVSAAPNQRPKQTAFVG
ncbi:hypothetical protein [Rhodococcus sp. GA1]|uniref:hypothetical protein n=1 Tax=Rhodococcus sp. GA1 TaxID=2942275 RepID=UPI0020CFC2E8|nr:hypothetical protein [Rhodococcus sp. GA1]